ncbi:MAG: hypothetical protein FWF43_07815 [Propionibacteriaceae bacterium]|nr:hypothetical protein [Propionibacteriaceae bacterium]
MDTTGLSDAEVFEAWCHAWAVGVLRVLKPGGHLAAFGGTRTWHRMVRGVESTGFEVRDQIAWLYSTMTRLRSSPQLVRVKPEWPHFSRTVEDLELSSIHLSK